MNKSIDPTEGIIIKILPDQILTDERGTITKLLDGVEIQSILVLNSYKGAIRSNHWHKRDWHFSIVDSGSLNYYERPVGSTEKPIKLKIEQGQIFFTKPKTEHCMEFLEDTRITCACRLPRDQKSYEDDTVRLGFDLSKL